jgi:hypothetical protein
MDVDLDDLDSILGKEDTPKPEVKVENKPNYGNNSGNYSKKEKKFNYWEEGDIEPKNIDKSSLKTGGTYFTVSCTNDIPDGDFNFIKTVTKTLTEAGYIFRSNGNSKNDVEAALTTIADNEIFLPWKKFNTDVEATLFKPKDDAFHYAANYHTKYKDLPGSVRSILGSVIHTIIGQDLKRSVKFMIIWTPDGEEEVEKMDYKKCMNVIFPTRVASDLDIPIFNIKNDESKKKLLEYLKGIGVIKPKEVENN